MPFPWLAAAVGGSAVLGVLGQGAANQANSALAQRQMDFQERMSSTAHQRQVKDLRLAGLNPILSASKGASSPGGATARMENVATPGINSALAAAQLANLYKTGDLIEAQTGKATGETAIIDAKLPRESLMSEAWKKFYGWITDTSALTVKNQEGLAKKAIQSNRKKVTSGGRRNTTTEKQLKSIRQQRKRGTYWIKEGSRRPGARYSTKNRLNSGRKYE